MSHPFDMFHVKSLEEAPGVTPLCGDHHVVVRLGPEVVPDTCNIERDLDGHSEFLLHIIDGLTWIGLTQIHPHPFYPPPRGSSA